MTFPRAHDYTFNPQVGCRKLSEGCKNCYMFLNQTGRAKLIQQTSGDAQARGAGRSSGRRKPKRRASSGPCSHAAIRTFSCLKPMLGATMHGLSSAKPPTLSI